jgi:hypothetical protein
MYAPTALRTPLADIRPAQREALVRRILGSRKPATAAPLDVAAFSSSL